MMKDAHNNLERFSSLISLNDGMIRLLIVLLSIETVSRSGNDFRELISKLFGRTWEFRILELLMKFGPMHKAQLCLKLFPDLNDSHYKLSRSNEISRAFKHLFDNAIIVVVKDLGHKKIYDISPSHKPVLRAIFYGNIFALLESR